MSSFTPFMIKMHFVRTNDSLEKDDDTIKIRKNLDNGEFELHYTDPNNSLTSVSHVFRTPYISTLRHHMYLTFKSLSMDDEPFYNVQFTMPAMPRMLVNIDKFNDDYYRDHFLELITSSLENFDKVTLTKSYTLPTHATSTHKDLEEVLGPSVEKYCRWGGDCDMTPVQSVCEVLGGKRRSSRLASSNVQPNYLRFDD